jgi:hypothetical protein
MLILDPLKKRQNVTKNRNRWKTFALRLHSSGNQSQKLVISVTFSMIFRMKFLATFS